MRIILSNYSTVMLTDVIISESMIGNIETISTLSTGETSFDVDLLVGSPRNLQFFAKGNDPTGVTRELSSCLLPVAYSGDDQDLMATPEPKPNSGRAFAFLNTTISRILTVLGVIMVISFITLIVLSMKERGRDISLHQDDDIENAPMGTFVDFELPTGTEDSQIPNTKHHMDQIADAAQAEISEPLLSLPEPNISVEPDTSLQMDLDAIIDQLDILELQPKDISSLNETFVNESMQASKHAERERSQAVQLQQSPKVIASRLKPVPQPRMRNQIRHIQYEEDEKAEW